MEAGPGDKVSNLNDNRLDCRRENLIVGNASQAMMRTRKRSDTSSIYKGVCWRPKRARWYAYISRNGRPTSLGHHASEGDAARAYDREATRLYGAFARLNFPDEQQVPPAV